MRRINMGSKFSFACSLIALVISLITLVAVLSGCSATPYVSVGVGYKVYADYWLQPEHAGGSSPTAHLEAGLEWETVRCGVYHWSHWLDGGPFNSRPETFKDEVMCVKTWRFGRGNRNNK